MTFLFLLESLTLRPCLWNLSKLEEEMVNTWILLPFKVHFFESTMETLYEHVDIYPCFNSEATFPFPRSSGIKFLKVASHCWSFLPTPCEHMLQGTPKSGLILEFLEGGIDFCLLHLVLDVLTDLVLDVLTDLVSPAPINMPATKQLSARP